ncbi:GTPase family protein [Marichromatium gracile]|uniref:GTP-binding protein HSR1 n=1 Tax=Marichromatium gracile TaxID=1048 RepID=A0ABR5VG75_MARGR|nr:GTPase [Marichromatium gracile]KXX64753.1 GTP-binding protein HSR1 [Marichromatium gracile]
MNPLLRWVGRWRALALAFWALPPLALLLAGGWWLYQQGMVFYWLLGGALCVLLGHGLMLLAARRERACLDAAHTGPDPDWTPGAVDAWAVVEQQLAELRPEDWPLGEGMRLGLLGQQTLERVARHFHPEVEQPLLELTLPHALLVIERASHDLRLSVTEQIPFSHTLTLGMLARLYRWKGFAERLYGLYRAGRWVASPTSALLAEALSRLRSRGYALARDELYAWVLREYVRKVGYYAIALYSGRLSLDETPGAAPPRLDESARDLDRSERESEADEPLRILVLGRANAGKSSLINALFGSLRLATDALPGTTREPTPLRLERDGLALGLVLDTPGLEQLDDAALHAAADTADMLLWVSPAHRPDRAAERARLDALRAHLAARPERPVPPLLLVLSHIDRLRPVREWAPPYDLNSAARPKAANIRAALEHASTDLAVPLPDAVPVALLPETAYNVDDALWSALLGRLDRASRARLLRVRGARQGGEDWRLLRRQLANAGRVLLRWPGGGRGD